MESSHVPEPGIASATRDDITWELDDEHMPFALAPLAEDYVRAIGDGFGGWPRKYSGGPFGNFEQLYWYDVVDGYAYVGHRAAITEESSDAAMRRTNLARALADLTAGWWQEEVLPELARLYGIMDGVPVETGRPADVVRGWSRAWEAFVATQDLHFESTLAPGQALDDLIDLFRESVPDATVVDGDRLIYGVAHELVQMEIDLEKLTGLIAASPDIEAAIRGGARSLAELRLLAGGSGLQQALEAFLTRHGHLGQSADDLSLASWSETPERLLAEVAKRLLHAPKSATRRLERQAAEAEDLADRARFALAADPETRQRFDDLLGLGRAIGPLMEVHNYWIDRKAQTHMRRLALRVGSRLVEAGAFEAPDDVLFLHRDEVAALIADPVDRRTLVANRRQVHRQQLATVPPRRLGESAQHQPPAIAGEGGEAEGGPRLLRGVGASAGIVRGPARVVRSSDEFDRIHDGDIIVCPASNPSWVPVFTIARGLVTNAGGILSHAAVVAREFGLPAVTGVAGATSTIRDGELIEIDGTAGTVRLL